MRSLSPCAVGVVGCRCDLHLESSVKLVHKILRLGELAGNPQRAGLEPDLDRRHEIPLRGPSNRRLLVGDVSVPPVMVTAIGSEPSLLE